MLTNVLLALVLSAAIALATGPKLIEWLRGHQMKTSENELGPKEHLKKRGTPIMGGLMIALGCIVSFVLCAAYTGAWVTTILPLREVAPDREAEAHHGQADYLLPRGQPFGTVLLHAGE